MRTSICVAVQLVALTRVCGLAAGGEAPPRQEKDFWYRPPMLGIMAHMAPDPSKRVSFEDWDAGLGSKFDADAWVRQFKELGASYVYFTSKWVDGFCYFDTKTTQFKSRRDYVREMAEACHRHGLRFCLYFNHHFDGNPEYKHLAVRDLTGKPYIRGFPFERHTVHGPFRQVALEQFRELVTHYGRVDGFWFDIAREVTETRDPIVTGAFRRMYGITWEQATDDDLADFAGRSLGGFFQDAQEVVRQANQPSCLLTMNGGLRMYTQGDAETKYLGPQMDFASQEGHYVNRLEPRIRRAGVVAKPKDIGVKLNENWFTAYQGPPWKALFNEKQAIAVTSLGTCYGAGVWLAVVPGYDGVFGEDLEIAKRVGAWFQKTRPALEGAQPVRDVGIIMGSPDVGCVRLADVNLLWKRYAMTRRDTVDEALHTSDRLLEAGYCSDLAVQWWDGTATWPHSLSAYRAVVLPETAMLDDGRVQELRDYVRGGGKLIAFGHASFMDANNNRRATPALADVFGVNVKEQIEFPRDLFAASVSTSSAQAGARQSNLVDGEPTIWQSGRDDKAPWIEVRFPDAIQLVRIELVNSKGSFRRTDEESNANIQRSEHATMFVRDFDVENVWRRDYEQVQAVRNADRSDVVTVNFQEPVKSLGIRIKLLRVVRQKEDALWPVQLEEIRVFDSHGRNWVKGRPQMLKLTDVKHDALAALAPAKAVLPPMALDAEPATAEVLARLDCQKRPAAIFHNRFGQGEALYVATGECALRDNAALWGALLEMLSPQPTLAFRGDLKRFAVILNRADRGVVLHVIDRFGGQQGVVPQKTEIAVDTSRFGKPSRVTGVDGADNLSPQWNGSVATLAVTPDPVATVVFELAGGVPANERNRIAQPTPSAVLAAAKPMVVPENLQPPKDRPVQPLSRKRQLQQDREQAREEAGK